MSKEMLNAFTMIEEEKGIKQEIVIEAIEQQSQLLTSANMVKHNM